MADLPSSPRGRVALLSLGCAKNLVDSEGLVGDLIGAGFELAETIDEADVALVNTCGFIEPAREESIDTILGVAAHKQDGRLRGIIVAGCMVQRHRALLEDSLPEVDRWLSFEDYGEIVRATEEIMELPTADRTASERVLLTPGAYAYLRISEGCNQKCAFCAIPAIRGRLASRSIEALVDDARTLAACGVAEVNIVSQDTTAYGRDLYGEPRLAQLLRTVTRIEGPRWWRVLYLYPTVLGDDVLEEIAGNDRIVKYVDLPLQHVTDSMLKAMRRGTTAAKQRALLERIRRIIPDVSIRTTLLTGFPGETPEDHEQALAFVREGWADRLGVFTYSREEGTASYDMPDPVPPEEAEERRAELMEAQQAIHFARQDERVGQTIDVLVESVDPETGEGTGRTARDAPEVDAQVFVANAAPDTPGSILRVRVTGRRGYDLEAVAASE